MFNHAHLPRRPATALARYGRRLRLRVYRNVRDERGVAGIEFALILPFLLILMLGASEMFLMSMATRKMTRVTDTVGDLITQADGTLKKSDIEGYFKAAKYIMGKFPASNLAVSVYTFKWDAKGRKPKLSWKHHLGGFVCKNDTPTLTVEQKASMQDGNDLVIAFGCYKYTVKIGSLVLGSKVINMTDEVALRPRGKPQVACSDCSS